MPSLDVLASITVIAISLALDALAVSVAGGLKTRGTLKDAIKIGLFFGGFQAGMPLIGWLAGNTLRTFVLNASGWIAFILLTLIGLKMIKESLARDHDEPRNILSTKVLLMLSVATSIDALVVGVSLSLVNLPLLISVGIIGLVTFALSVFGFLFGRKLGVFFAGKVEVLGGIALICIGIKLLVTS